LKESLDVLAAIDAPLARQILDINLARPGHARFFAQILSHLAAPAQDARALLGEAGVNGLERAGRHDLLARLDGDLRDVNRANAAAADWRMFFVPIVDTHDVRQLRVFTRKKKQGSHDREAGGRFVVEVEFEDIGELQVDGLVQKPRIDVIVRSHTGLSPEMQAGILEVFDDTCGAAGLIGQLFFQTMPTFPVSPLEEITKHSPGGVSI
jgi:hypothetical protein